MKILAAEGSTLPKELKSNDSGNTVTTKANSAECSDRVCKLGLHYEQTVW